MGCYYYGARYYDQEIGRFTQADTIVPRPLDGQTFNRYSYANNNPYRYSDPSGHFFTEAFAGVMGLIGAIFGMIVGASMGYQSFGLLGLVAGGAIGFGYGRQSGLNFGGRIGANVDAAAVYTAGVALQAIEIGSQLAAMCGIGFAWSPGGPKQAAGGANEVAGSVGGAARLDNPIIADRSEKLQGEYNT